jgi:lipoprotein-anchoring transpeptidase ErfK/SrfK
MVAFGGYSPGTIVVHTHERRLYLVVGNGRRCAIRSASAAPASNGAARRDRRKYLSPRGRRRANTARKAVPAQRHSLAGRANPMGVAAMTLAGGEYAIHGTNQPGSIGGFVSYGCIRMHNADITDLFARVSVGAVIVTR